MVRPEGNDSRMMDRGAGKAQPTVGSTTPTVVDPDAIG